MKLMLRWLGVFIFFSVVSLSLATAIDVGISQGDSPDPLSVGCKLTYTLTVTNTSGDDPDDIVVTNWLPESVTLISSTSTMGTCTGTNPVVCNLGNLLQGNVATIQIAVTPNAVGSMTNIAEVSSTIYSDSNTNDNIAAIDTTVVAAPDDTQGSVFAVESSPAITGDPDPDQNNTGDNFDLNTAGGALVTRHQCGFGDFGQIYVNYDATNLYIGATNANVDGTDNGMVIFIGMDTLTDNATDLTTMTNIPNGLNFMHNLSFNSPMDLAVLLGDEYGDGSYPSFSLEGGQDFGQGAFYLSSDFFPVGGMSLSQFDGTGSDPTTSGDDDFGNRQVDRWEVALPWSSLNAPAGIDSLSDLQICGIVAGGNSGDDRYISGNFLGTSASGTLDADDNYGFSSITLFSHTINLPLQDFDGDGMPNSFETSNGLNPTNATDAIGDEDGDTMDNLSEYIADTNPQDNTSLFEINSISNATSQTVIFPSSTNRVYSLQAAGDLTSGSWLDIQTGVVGEATSTSLVDTNDTSDVRIYRVGVGLPGPI